MLHPEKIAEVKHLLRDHSHRAVARMTGVSYGSVGNIARGIVQPKKKFNLRLRELLARGVNICSAAATVGVRHSTVQGHMASMTLGRIGAGNL